MNYQDSTTQEHSVYRVVLSALALLVSLIAFIVSLIAVLQTQKTLNALAEIPQSTPTHCEQTSIVPVPNGWIEITNMTGGQIYIAYEDGDSLLVRDKETYSAQMVPTTIYLRPHKPMKLP